MPNLPQLSFDHEATLEELAGIDETPLLGQGTFMLFIASSSVFDIPHRKV